MKTIFFLQLACRESGALPGSSVVNSGVECGVLSGRSTRNSEQNERLVKASESPRIKG